MSKQVFEVWQWTLQGWANCWRVEGADGIMRPEVFATHAEAQEALDDHLDDLKAAALAGDTPDDYSPDDFKIVQIDRRPD